jgi:hypothetical protein
MRVEGVLEEPVAKNCPSENPRVHLGIESEPTT